MTQEGADTRERILDAAEDAFAEGGFAAARVASIAEVAGANKAMLYYYFGSKAELYQAVLERTLDRIAELASGVLADPAEAPDRRVQGFLHGYFQLLRDRPRFPRMVMRELLDGGENLQPLLQKRLPMLLSTFGMSMAQEQDHGAFNRAADPRYLPMVLVAPFVVFANVGPFFEQLFKLDAQATAIGYEQTALAILMDGLRPRADGPTPPR